MGGWLSAVTELFSPSPCPRPGPMSACSLCLEQCLGHGRHSLSISEMNRWMDELTYVSGPGRAQNTERGWQVVFPSDQASLVPLTTSHPHPTPASSLWNLLPSPGCGCRWLLGQAASNFFFGLNLEVSLNVKGEECTLLLLVSEAVVTSVSPHTCSGTD